ncbi:MAG: hypothetical protein J6I85_06510, partial [Clostridia bacterium]|nr:hypothetical protein [Clostridia bacterium]
MGRFTSEDTYRGEITDPLSRKLYLYTKNDPVNYIDPRGKEMFKFYYKITPQIYEGEIKYIDNEYSFDFFPYRNSDIYILLNYIT